MGLLDPRGITQSAADARYVHQDGTGLPSAVVTADASGGIPQWASGTAYAVNDLVSEGGTTYICTKGHTSGDAFAAESSDWTAIVPGAESGGGVSVPAGSSTSLPTYYLAPPSGDKSGTTDLAAFNAAITALTSTGGTLQLQNAPASSPYILSGEIVLPVVNIGPAITIAGTGRESSVLTWPSDLGSGKYALRIAEFNAGGSEHRVQFLKLQGPGGTFSSPPGMHGMNLSSNGAAEDIVINGFNRGLSVTNGNQEYRLVTTTSNYHNLYLINNIGSGDVDFTACDFTGCLFASVAVDSGPGTVGGITFNRCHVGFGPIGIYLMSGAQGGLGLSEFNDVQFEQCGNYLIYGVGGSGLTGCVFTAIMGASGYGGSTYFEPSLGQTAPIYLAAGGQWSSTDVKGIDALTPPGLPSGVEAFIVCGNISESNWEHCGSLLDVLRGAGLPFAITQGGYPSTVEFSDGSARMLARQASLAVAQDTIVQPDTYEQVKPMTNSSGAIAQGVAKLAVPANATTIVAIEGRTSVNLAAAVVENAALAPSPSTPTQAAAAVGPVANVIGWAQGPGSAGGSVEVCLRPSYDWQQDGKANPYFPSSVAWYANALAVATSAASSGVGLLLLHPFFSGAPGITIAEFDTYVNTAYGSGATLMPCVYAIINQANPFEFSTSTAWATLLEGSGSMSLSSTGLKTLTLGTSLVIPPNTWFAVGGMEQGTVGSGTRTIGSAGVRGPFGTAGPNPALSAYASPPAIALAANPSGGLPSSFTPAASSSVDSGVGFYRSA